MMVKINLDEFEDIKDDIDFAKKLLNEYYYLVTPSDVFFAKNFFRIVSLQIFYLKLFVDYLHNKGKD
jgi:aspartate/methionine/tyrosine aminotransferase